MARNVIGQGGFGTVVKQQINGRTVAVKSLSAADHPRSLRREVNILKELQHPNVVEYIDVFHTKEGTLVNIVTEFCERGDLKNFIKSPEKCYSISTVIDWASQLFDALTYLQEKAVFHRDLKPSNILLGAQHELKLCDFGLSKAEESEYSGYGVVGTLRYTPPEALGFIEGKHQFTHASDLYGVGLVLWETIERRQVFLDPKVIHATLVFRICYGEPLERPQCRSQLADLVERCCSREMAKRPTAIEALTEILKIKELPFYDLFLMEPCATSTSPTPQPPFGALEDADLVDIKTIRPEIPKKPLSQKASVVLGKARFEQLQQVFNNNDTGALKRSTSVEEITMKRFELRPLAVKTPLSAPLEEEDEEVTLKPLKLTNSNREDRTIIAGEHYEHVFQNEVKQQPVQEIGEGSHKPYMSELKAAFMQRYINVEKLEEEPPKPSTSAEPPKSDDDSGFLEKSTEFEPPKLQPIRLAPDPPPRTSSPLAPFTPSPPVLPPKFGWNPENFPRLRDKKPLDDPDKAREKLLHRRSLPNPDWKPPVPPRRKESPALRVDRKITEVPEPPPRKVSLHRDVWVSDELLTIWCKNLVLQHPTWSGDLLKHSIQSIVEQKSESKMTTFLARVMRHEATTPSGPGYQLACVVRLELGVSNPYPYLKGFDLFFRNFLRKCDFFTVSKARYREALEYCFHILMRDDSTSHNVYQEVVMLLLAFDLAKLKEWASLIICDLLKTSREFLGCEVAKRLLIRSDELLNDWHKRWLREEADSLAQGATLDQRLFVLRALP